MITINNIKCVLEYYVHSSYLYEPYGLCHESKQNPLILFIREVKENEQVYTFDDELSKVCNENFSILTVPKYNTIVPKYGIYIRHFFDKLLLVHSKGVDEI